LTGPQLNVPTKPPTDVATAGMDVVRSTSFVTMPGLTGNDMVGGS